MIKKIITYKESGVDIQSGEDFVQYIKEKVGAPPKNVMSAIGGFGALFNLKDIIKNMQEPVLISSTDGVGTKLLVAQEQGIHNTIGIDLVAMCVNDILAQGATPLYFLDYLAIGRINQETIREVMDGILQGCNIAELALVGGETAEMPDMYTGNKYDLAGFAVGIVDKTDIQPKINNMSAGDVLIGIKSSGYHSNGYSLLRKIPINPQTMINDKSFKDTLMTPTKIYTKVMSKINHLIKGVAHITGGGINHNLPRIIPSHLKSVIQLNSWEIPLMFSILAEYGVERSELFNVFNMGLGMICVVSPEQKEATLENIQQSNEEGYVIGYLQNNDREVSYVEYQG